MITRLLHGRSYLFLPVYLLCLVAAVAMAFLARQNHVFPGDLYLAQLLQSIHYRWWAELMLFMTALGQAGADVVVVLAALVLLVALRARIEAIFVALTPTAYSITWVTKLLVARPRPEAPAGVSALFTDYSFPSAHVLHTTVFYGFLVYLVWSQLRSSPLRTVLASLLAVPIVLMGASRVYLGAHWPSDVVGGYLLGGLYLVAMVQFYQLFKRRSAGHG